MCGYMARPARSGSLGSSMRLRPASAWRLVGETVQVVMLAGRIIARHAGEIVADHPVCAGRGQRTSIAPIWPNGSVRGASDDIATAMPATGVVAAACRV